jgi:molybdate transport system permease protein
VASVALFDEVEALNFQQAHFLALILFVLSFAILAALFTWNRKGVEVSG